MILYKKTILGSSGLFEIWNFYTVTNKQGRSTSSGSVTAAIRSIKIFP